MRPMFVWLVVLLPTALAAAGDLPLTAEDALEGRTLRPEEHFMTVLPVRVTALRAEGRPAPAMNILGPQENVPQAGGTFAIPPCWLYVVEAGAPPGSAFDLGKLVEWAKILEVPGLQLRMQPRVDDAFVGSLAGLASLEYLGLGRTRVTDQSLAHAAKMPKLLALELDGATAVTDAGLAHLAAHPSLAALRLEGVRGVTDAGALHLATLPKLIWLDLAQTSVTDAGIAALAKPGRLRVFDVRQCVGVTDEGMKSLAKLKDLRALGLESVPVTDAGLKQLLKLRALEALDLGMTRVTDAGVAKLKGAKALRWLSLNALPVGDKAVTWLKRSKTIEALDLTDTQVTVKGLGALRGKASLRELKLRGPMLTDAGLEIVGTLTGLERLYLHNATDVTDEGVAHLAAIDHLEAFGISAAPKVTDALLDVLAKHDGLRWVSLDRCTGLTKEGVARLRAALPQCRVIDPWELGVR